MEALEGAWQLIEKCHPILLIEQIKAGRERLRAWLQERGYKLSMRASICWQFTRPIQR